MRRATSVAREVPPEKRKSAFRSRFLHFLVAITIVMFVQLTGPSWVHAIRGQMHLNSFGGCAALLAALFLSLLAQEVGFLSAALFLNYEILGAALGPVRLDCWRKRLFPRIEKGMWSPRSVLSVPREIRNCWRGRMLCVSAVRPAVSLVACLAGCLFALNGKSAISFCSVAAEVNFFLLVLGLIPNGRSAPEFNDAALFLSIYKRDADSGDLQLRHQAIELGRRHSRPAYYPNNLLTQWTQSSNAQPITRLIIAKRMVEWAFDSENFAAADEWDQLALEFAAHCGYRQGNIALAESACFDVIFRNNYRAARQKFVRVDFEQLFPPTLASRAWAARLIACDLPLRAPAHILRAQHQLAARNASDDYERTLLGTLHMKALSPRSLPRAGNL